MDTHSNLNQMITMNNDSVQVTFVSGRPSMMRHSISPLEEKLLYAMQQSDQDPVVYVVVNASLDVFRGFEDQIIDRRKKNIHKGLAEYFLKKPQKKIQLISTEYSSAKKLLSGLRPLLQRAEKQPLCKTFIVGVSEEVFAEIWQQAQKQVLVRNAPAFFTGQTGLPEREVPLDEREYRLLHYLVNKHGRAIDLEQQYIGKARSVEIIRMLILAAAKVDAPVLILGDTGTGKEVVARQIHEHSEKKKNNFMVVNCGSIPRELLELELFGCEANALQKGYPTKKGLWEVAGKGTLFLDEIGELSLDHQVKILRALQEQKIRRVGGTEEITVHARVVAATNRNLYAMVQAGTFREDLYYRLRGFFIRTPALRDHANDIPVLARFLWKKITKDMDASLSSAVVRELCRYSWPGNVRELNMVLTHLYSLFQTKNPDVANLQDTFFLEGQTAVMDTAVPATGNEIKLQRAQCLKHLKRTHEVLHACRYKVKLFLADRINTIDPLVTVTESILLLHHELEQLCLSPLFFHSESVYESLDDFKNQIATILPNNQTVAVTVLEHPLLKGMKDLLALVFREIEAVMEEG